MHQGKNTHTSKNRLEFREGIYVKKKAFDKILYTFIINTFSKLGLKGTFFFFLPHKGNLEKYKEILMKLNIALKISNETKMFNITTSH